MKKSSFKSLLFAVFCGFCAFGATAATSLFSDYGQIQNVQNYSTNPFWTPNAPYNQRLPQPVYVQGADLTAEDCFKVVQSLVSVQCMARDNCQNTTLADIRPTVMVQLSNLPGNNYVSACSGFIDGVFESYVAQYGNNIPNRAVAFPAATSPNPNVNNNNNNTQIQNPYKQTIPQWKQEIIERSQELQELQQQNSAGSQQLSAADFPMTFDDLSFEERMALKTEDYAQYKDMNAYVVPDFKNIKEWCEGNGAGTAECKRHNENQNQQQAKNNQQNPPASKQNKTKEQQKDNEKSNYVARIRIRGSLPGTHEGRVASKGKQCFAVCGESTNDDLNMKVLKNVMKGKYYCARKEDGLLVENKNQKQILKMTLQQKNTVKQQIVSMAKDKGNCDWRVDNVVVLFGEFNSDGEFGSLDEVLLDD